MKKYYFNNQSEEREYGIYESLLENQNRIDYNNKEENLYAEKKPKLKSLGAVNKDDYLFFVGDIDKSDHFGLATVIESKIGFYNYWFSFWYKKDFLQRLNIYYTTDAEPKTIKDELIELEYLMDVISECQLYNNYNANNKWRVEIVLPSIFFDKQSEQVFTNASECLYVIQNKYNELKNSLNDNYENPKILVLNKNTNN